MSAPTMLQEGELLLAILGDTGDSTSSSNTGDHLVQTPPSVEELTSLYDFMGHLQNEQALMDMSFTSSALGMGTQQQQELAAGCYIAQTNALNDRKEQPRTADGTPKKKRKATYYMRKEEKSALEQQIQHLQAQVESLRSNRVILSSVNELSALERSRDVNKLLNDAVKQQQFSFAGVQSALAQQVSAQHNLPFETYIKLGRDWRERRATLLAAKTQMLQGGLRYVIERLRFLNPSTPFAETSRYATPSGDYCSLVFDIIPFEGITDVKLVFDALQFYFHNIEISISELLGEITVREDDGSKLESTFQNRIVSNVGEGVQVELNGAMFCQMCKPNELYGGGHEYGLIVASIIDEDELFPYSPETRLRQDVTAAVTVTLQPRSATDDDEKLVVVVTRTCLLNLRSTQLPISSPVMHMLRDGIERWGDAMMKKARDIVYSQQCPIVASVSKGRFVPELGDVDALVDAELA